MPSSTTTSESQFIEIEQIYLLYAGLLDSDIARDSLDALLGGSLLYAGEPAGETSEPTSDPTSRLLRAANIAGAASLAASADAGSLRRLMREGAIDFAVNSLDEALRILKNEIRKRQPVAVGVSLAPAALLAEMLDRGVLPDLLAPNLPDNHALIAYAAQGARCVKPAALADGVHFHVLSIPEAWWQQTAAFDAFLLECLREDDHANRRWVRLATRYLPASARRLRSLACNQQTFAQLMERVSQPPNC